MRLGPTIITALACAAPILGHAQPVTGLYIGAGVGANFINNPENWDLSGSAAPGNFGLPNNVTVTNAGKANFDTGVAVVGSLGWGFGNGFRAEVEGNWRGNEVDSVRGQFAPVGRLGGFQQAYGVMVNGFYDFDLASFGLGPSFLRPYTGVGLGYAWTEWHNIRGRSFRSGSGRGARPGAHLPGLLRLGSRRPDRPRAGDHRRGGAERQPRAGDAHRGGRPCRPLRHAAVQPAPVAAPRRRGRGRAGGARDLAQRDHRHRLWREPPLVPTADDVREPQNRRVEIVLR